MRILVLGATGRTGRHVVDQARARGHDVSGLVRSASAVRTAFTAIAGDPTEADVLASVLPRHDIVISCLGQRVQADGGILQHSAEAMRDAMRHTDLPWKSRMKRTMRMISKLFNFTAALLAVVGPASAQTISPRAVVEAKFAAFNRHAIADIAALYAPDARLTASDFCKPRQGRAEVERTYRGIFAFLPDAVDDVQEYVVQGDRVAVRFVLRGTIGGHAFSAPLMNFFTVRGGLIVDDDGIFDNGGRACTP